MNTLGNDDSVPPGVVPLQPSKVNFRTINLSSLPQDCEQSYLSYMKTKNKKTNGANVAIQREPEDMAKVLDSEEVAKLFLARLKDLNEMSHEQAKDLHARFE